MDLDQVTGALKRAVTRFPECKLAIFAALLNFAWEMLQMPLFLGMADARFADTVKVCLQATLGDVVLMLIAYWSVAAIARSRRWILAPNGWQLALFIAIGVAFTVVIEWLATRGHWVGSWTYSKAMPMVPGLDIGLSPLLQWLVLPLLVAWFVARCSSPRT